MLVKTDEDGRCWYPTSVSTLESYLGKYIVSPKNYTGIGVLKKDLAYNLQYLEFQARVLQDIKLSSVLYTQTIKAVVLISSSIIESLLHYSIIEKGLQSTTEWREKAKIKGNQKNVDGEKIRIDTIILKKLDMKSPVHMTFESMIKIAKYNSLFGANERMYSLLEKIRKLRNRIHLQPDDKKQGTDWTAFNANELNECCAVMYSIFSSSLFSPTIDERKLFQYLNAKYGA